MQLSPRPCPKLARVNLDEIQPFIAEQKLRARVGELAAQLARDYRGAPLTLLCILEGARRFCDDLLLHLQQHGLKAARLDVRARRSRGTKLGALHIAEFNPAPLAGRCVLIVDDICDGGETLRGMQAAVAKGGAQSIRTCVLLRREGGGAKLRPDYIGFPIREGWAVGYGMDLAGRFRELNWIGVVTPTC